MEILYNPRVILRLISFVNIEKYDAALKEVALKGLN